MKINDNKVKCIETHHFLFYIHLVIVKKNIICFNKLFFTLYGDNLMKVLKKIASCLFAVVLSSHAYADIIELDAFNPDHCRQQLLQSTDDLPVVATYTTDDTDSERFMRRFERLAKEHPERTFFKWDAKKDLLHGTQTICLQQLGFFVQPNIILLGIIKDDNSDSGKTIMTSPLRLQWSGFMSQIEMDNFIHIFDAGMKKSILTQKNRY